MGRTIFEIMTFSFCVMDEINNWFKRLGLQFLALQLCSACQTMEPPPYDLNPDCSQLAAEVSSWSRALPMAKLS